MTNRRSLKLRSLAAAAISLAAAAGGCTSDTAKVYPTMQLPSRAKGTAAMDSKDSTPPSNASNLDPCALRLHDLIGSLLLYYFTYQRMPVTLDELNSFPGADQQIPLTCPTSSKPYVYAPNGVLLPEQNARIVIYDPTPAHYGNYRWAIRMEDPVDGKPIVARVIALPERFFTFLSPTTP